MGREVNRTAVASGVMHGDESDMPPVKRRRTRKEALQAALVMQEFLQELNIPYAGNLEAELHSFGYQTHYVE